MAMVFFGLVAIMGDLGTAAAVIQRKELDQRFLSTVFWFNVMLGIASTAALALLAPLIGRVYGQPALVPLLRVLSLAFVMSSLTVLQQALLERRLALRQLALVELSSVVLASIVAVALALGGAGVWSMVFQTLVYAGMLSALLWIVGRWRPSLVLSWSDTKGTVGFSLNLSGFNIVNYFVRNSDNFLVGKYLGAHDLGLYSLAYRILLFPVQNVSWVISRVMFPVYSRIHEDPERLRNMYLRSVSAIALVTFPLMMGAMVLSEPFSMAVFGPKWSGLAVLITVLAPVGLVQSVASTVGAIYMAKGRTDWLFRWGVLSAAVTISGFVIGLQWGVVGVAASYAVASLALLYPSFAIPFRLIDLAFRDLLRALRGVAAASLIMAASLVAVQLLLPGGLSPAAVLLVTVPLGAAIYLGAVLLLDRGTVLSVIRALRAAQAESPSRNVA